jgi:transcriptional regulator with XRE-family HTH domain
VSDLTEAFGERLLVARFNYHHITQETLADRAGIHRTQITLLESGRRDPQLTTFVKLAGSCGVSADELLGPIRALHPHRRGRRVTTERDANLFGRNLCQPGPCRQLFLLRP